jgi:multidrug resistance efflux pump
LETPKVLGALIIEQIEDSRPRDGLTQRIEVVSDHSSIALANVLEHNELFMMPVWRTLGKSKWVVEARQLPKTIAAAIAAVVLLLILCLWPADLQLTGKGKLQPAIRREVFANLDGEVVEVFVKHGDKVKKGDPLAQMRSIDLEVKITEAEGQIEATKAQLSAVTSSITGKTAKLEEQNKFLGERLKLELQLQSLKLQLQLYKEKTKKLKVVSPIDGEVLTWQVYERLIFRTVQQGQILMSVVDPDGPWEVEVQMPEDRMGFIVDAQRELGEELPVNFITATKPGESHEGKVKEIHHSAEVRDEEGNTVLLRVDFDKRDLSDLRDGGKVTAKVYCGRAPIGYVWFHDLVSFWQSKVWFRIW